MSKKNFLKTLLGCFMMAMCWMPVAAQGATMRGDADDNGDVNISDAIAMIAYLSDASASNVRNLSAADVDYDGNVTITDVIIVINFLSTNTWPYVPTYETFTVSGVTFRMVVVPGGTFRMGAYDDDTYARPWEKPAHDVTLSAYRIGETEVTQALWRAVMGSNPSWFTGNLNRPVECVAYSDCVSFINKLNFRLPTEAEWEYAARGGNISNGYLYSGSANVDDVAWYKSTAGNTTHPVATLAPNELGLYDMSGNVDEWCADWYDLYTGEAQTNPTGPATGSFRVTRGGNWDSAFRNCRVTYRYDAIVTSNTSHNGLRLAL